LYFVVVGSFTTGWLWALLFIPRRFLVLRRTVSPHATASLAPARTRNSSCYATARTTDPTNDDDAPTPAEPAALGGAELPKGGSMADWPLLDGPPGGSQEAEMESGRLRLNLVGAHEAEKAEEFDDED
jgi:hypothetical protein